MKTAIRRLSALSILLLFMLCLSVPAAFATDVARRVFDYADLLSSEEEAQLFNSISELSKETDLDYIFLSVNSTDGKSPRDYADDFYDDHDFGSDSEGSGILLLIDMGERQIWFSTKGEAIDIFTDARIDSMYNGVKTYMQKQDYAGAANYFLERAKVYVNAGVPDGAYRRDEETGEITYYEKPKQLEPLEILIAIAVPLLVGGGFFGFVCLKYGRQSKPCAYPFQNQSRLNLTGHEDRFIRQSVTTRHIDTSSHSGGGGGRSSTHTSSSGSTHGGGGGGF